MKKKIIFLGTTDFAAYQLQALHNSDVYKITMIISQPDRKAGRSMKLQQSAVKKYALKNNLPIITPEKMNLALSEIKNLKAEAAIVVAYGQILSQDFLDLYPQKVINLHASLLPKWRGAAPIQRAIMAGDTVTGISLQVMVKALDAGDIIAETKINISKNLNSIELQTELQLLGPSLLLKDLKIYLDNPDKVKLTKQDDRLVTYASKIQKSEQQINWQQSAQKIHNFVRGLALNRGALATFTIKDTKLTCKIHKTAVQTQTQTPELQKHFVAGSVVAIHLEHFVIACGKNKNEASYLKILELQLASRGKISAKDFYAHHKKNI